MCLFLQIYMELMGFVRPASLKCCVMAIQSSRVRLPQPACFATYPVLSIDWEPP